MVRKWNFNGWCPPHIDYKLAHEKAPCRQPRLDLSFTVIYNICSIYVVSAFAMFVSSIEKV